MFLQKDICTLRNSLTLCLKPLGVKPFITEHAKTRALERGQDFDVNDILFTVTRFRDYYNKRLVHAAQHGKLVEGVIQDHINWMTILFEMNKIQGEFAIVTLLRRNPQKFYSNRYNSEEIFKIT